MIGKDDGNQRKDHGRRYRDARIRGPTAGKLDDTRGRKETRARVVGQLCGKKPRVNSVDPEKKSDFAPADRSEKRSRALETRSRGGEEQNVP